MGKRLTEIKFDGVSFNAKYWAQQSLADFKKEANKPDAAMVPETVAAADKDKWLTQAFDLIKKANDGDDSARPEITTEDIEAEAAKAESDKKAKATTKGTAAGTGG